MIQVKDAKIPINYKDIYVEYAVRVDEEEKEIFKTNVVRFSLFRLPNRPIFQCLTTARCTS